MRLRHRALCGFTTISETVDGDSYCYLLPEGKGDHTRIGVLTVPRDRLGRLRAAKLILTDI